MEANEKRRIVEALVLSSTEPISAARLAEIVPGCEAGEIKDLVNELNTEYGEQDRSFEIWEVAGGFQIRTRAEFSGYLQKLQKERALRLSQAALETLAIIAYRQPVTRAEIEDVRGVDAGATVKSLLERHLIRIAGQREVPGRPMLYGTTRRFLEIFGLESLKNLPTLRELDELAREQGLLERSGTPVEGGGEAGAEGAIFDGASGEGELVVRHEDLPGPSALREDELGAAGESVVGSLEAPLEVEADDAFESVGLDAEDDAEFDADEREDDEEDDFDRIGADAEDDRED